MGNPSGKGGEQPPQPPNEQEEDNDLLDKFVDEDYEGTIEHLDTVARQSVEQQKKDNQSVYDQTVQQAYLLTVFTEMAVEMCQSKVDMNKEKEPEINWHINLVFPIQLNQNLVASTGTICAPKTFHTKLAKTETIHSSSCVARCPIAVTDKFMFVLSGPKIIVYMKEQLIACLIDKWSERTQLRLGNLPSCSEKALHF
jgi:hypothetical protein